MIFHQKITASGLILAFALVGSITFGCKSDNETIRLCEPAVSVDCPLQLFTSYDGVEELLLAGVNPEEANEETDLRAVAISNAKGDEDTLRLGCIFRIFSNAPGGGILFSMEIADIVTTSELTDEAFLAAIKNNDFKFTETTLIEPDNRIYFNHYPRNTLSDSLYVFTDHSESLFTIDDAILYPFEGQVYVRFIATISAPVHNWFTGRREYLDAGRIVGVFVKPQVYGI